MKSIQNTYDKFSIVLTLTMVFIALPAIAAAQGKFFFQNNRDGVMQIFSMNPDGSNPMNLSNNGAEDSQPDVSANGETRSASNHSGGILVVMGDGSVRFSAKVSRIALPDSGLDFDFVDADDSNAAIKTRLLLEAADRLRRGIVINVPRGMIRAQHRFPKAEIFVSESNNPNFMEVELQDVLISSYQTSGHGGRLPMESLSLNFTKIEYR